MKCTLRTCRSLVKLHPLGYRKEGATRDMQPGTKTTPSKCNTLHQATEDKLRRLYPTQQVSLAAPRPTPRVSDASHHAQAQ